MHQRLNQCWFVCNSASYTKHSATEMSVTVISSPGLIYGFPKNKGPLASCLLLRGSWAEGDSLCGTWHWAIQAQGQAGRGGGGTVKYDHRLPELTLGSSRFSHSFQNEKVTQRELKWMLPRKRKKKRAGEGGNARAREADKDITPREIWVIVNGEEQNISEKVKSSN